MPVADKDVVNICIPWNGKAGEGAPIAVLSLSIDTHRAGSLEIRKTFLRLEPASSSRSHRGPEAFGSIYTQKPNLLRP
jgi:hypothetical protein